MSDTLADLRFGDLITFLTVHRCGAITGAARALEVTPSQVSKAVHRLERQLGATLLSRSTRGVIVSDAGRRLIPQLEEVAARLQQMRPDADTREELALAAPSYLNAIFLPRIAAELSPTVVRGLELPPALVRAYAVENFFDVALVVGTERLPGAWVGSNLGLVRKALFAAPEVARKLGAQPVDPKRLAELPFVTPIYNVNGQFVPADDACPLGHAHRKLGHQSTTLVVGLDLARSTGQLIFGPAIAAHAHVARGELVEIRVRGWDVSEPLTLAVNGERVRAKTQKQLMALVTRTLDELDG
ncbi:MAG TPA: LysR family transcriptional regulator [Polyangia bacterium]|jgi:DNA-binding transcriptional LysR family regulator